MVLARLHRRLLHWQLQRLLQQALRLSFLRRMRLPPERPPLSLRQLLLQWLAWLLLLRREESCLVLLLHPSVVPACFVGPGSRTDLAWAALHENRQRSAAADLA